MINDSYRISVLYWISLLIGYVSKLIQQDIQEIWNQLLLEMCTVLFIFVCSFYKISSRHIGFKQKLSFNITGYIFGKALFIGVYQISVLNSEYKGGYLYMISLIIYHTGEFMFVCFNHLQLLSWDSFLINHSVSYAIAFGISMMEYFVGIYFFLDLKNNFLLMIVGIILSLVGHTFRIGAFYTARSNFHHIVQSKKQENHILVTNGVYAIARHPSYLGFFLFNQGSQILLENPLSLCTNAYVLWTFFSERILYEEIKLIQFFGKDYEIYRQKTPIYIPFIQQYLDKQNKSF